ncbi:MAG: anti-sigma F factor [Clostridia bacterium]|nr:anti-sigma F factor [Clostridia bacterium]
MYNKMSLNFLSLSENEAFARNVIAMFSLSINPTLNEISDVKTAVSEAVTNAIVHGYPDTVGSIDVEAEIQDDILHIIIRDYGVGINNVEEVLEPFYTTKPEEERSGMGFTIMKNFMDKVTVESKINKGTIVKMTKTFKK